MGTTQTGPKATKQPQPHTKLNRSPKSKPHKPKFTRVCRLKPDRERILYTTFILRSIYRNQFSALSDGDRRLADAIYSLVRQKLLTTSTTIQGDKMLHLTKRGYNYVCNNVLSGREPQYNFMTSRTRRIPSPLHQFMNMKFLWKFVRDEWKMIKTQDVRIYTDSDTNNCRLEFDYQWGKIDLRPDILIRIARKGKNERLIMVENDRGTENTIQIYRKFLRYAFYLDTTKMETIRNKEIYYPNVDIYFVTVGRKRLENLFVKGNLANYFNISNTFRDKFRIGTDKVLELFSSPAVGLYLMDYERFEPRRHNLWETIVKNPGVKECFLMTSKDVRKKV